jgi:serine/threonine protein kinase
MMVLEYAENGSLRNYLDTNHNELNFKSKINYLFNIASGIENIHGNEIIHRDLHIGNILKNYETILITDMGLCKPVDYNASENTKNNIYGVLPYIAPEILRGKNYTKAADIYSFGIIMCEVISRLPPYHDLRHDNNLAMKICQGLRPRFNIKVPQSIVHLSKRCLDANPSVRPTALEVRDKLWEFKINILTDIQKQTNEENNNLSNSKRCLDANPSVRPTAFEVRDKLWEFKIDILTDIQKQTNEENNDNLSNSNKSQASSSIKTHPEAIYISRLLNFNDLPEPKNSDDYYEKTDDIISNEFSGINQ